MNVKKVLAGGLVAAAAGATLAFGALAQSANLGAYVQVTDSSLTSPIIVVGTQTASLATEYPNDILGAADIAAAAAGYATTPVTIGGGTIVSVSGGVDLSTANTKAYLGDQLIKAGLRTTLTATDLPDILAKGTFTDNAGASYTYNHYITFGNGNLTFGTAGGNLNDPKLYLDTGTGTTVPPLYNMSVVFNKPLNISNSDVQGQSITLFGKDYTIGSDSAFWGSGSDKLVLFGGAGSTQIISEGQEATMSVGGVSHTVKVIGVSSETTAVISIDGVTQTVTKGQTKVINGVSVFAKSIFYFGKESQISQVEVGLGANKITLQQASSVKTGQNDENTIDGTTVTLTGTGGQGISKLDISVTAKDASSNYVVAGSAFTDPVFNAFKVAFGGLAIGTTDTITVDNSGTNAASLKFTDYRNNEKSILWAYTTTTSFNPQLNSSSTISYHVTEAESVKLNDYVFMAPTQESEFGHIFQYSTASSLGNTGAYIELKDAFSGDTTRIYLTDTVGGVTNVGASFYIDGQQYFVNTTASSRNAVFSWGSSAGKGVDGDKVMEFPLIKTKAGEYVTLVKSIAFANDTYEFPGNTTATLNACMTSVPAGRLTYIFAAGCGTSNTLTGINATSSTRVVNLTAAPAVLVYEGKAKNVGDTADVQDAIFVTINGGSGTGTTQMTITQPTLTEVTAAAIGFPSQTTDNSVTETYNRRGTHVTYDSDSQGLATIVEPQDQASGMVAAGSSPTFSSSGTGGTYNSAVQIKYPVSKFDNEVSTTGLSADLILVGGPCANSLVSTLLQSTENTVCVDSANPANQFISKYPNGLIKEVSNAFSSGHKALIVAGTNGAGTRALAAKVMSGTLSFQ
jgi:hypothetical protein